MRRDAAPNPARFLVVFYPCNFDRKQCFSGELCYSTLGELFGVGHADEDELYAALDWLLARQDAIEQRLAKRHLHNGGRAPCRQAPHAARSHRARAGDGAADGRSTPRPMPSSAKHWN